MTHRRMFSTKILSSIKFLSMPPKIQNLYVHLGMATDDEGVVEALQIIKILNLNRKNLQVLIENDYIFELNHDYGIFYFIHFYEHNQLKADRIKPSNHHDLLVEMLPKCLQNVSKMSPDCIQNGDKMETKCPTKRREEKRREENKKENNIKEKSAKGCTPIVSIDNFTDNDFSHLSDKTFCDNFIDFLNERINRKKPASKVAQKNILTDLQKHPLATAIEMLRRSISSGWLGVFPLKQQNFNTGKQNENNKYNNSSFTGNAKPRQHYRDVFAEAFKDVSIDGYLASVAESNAEGDYEEAEDNTENSN